MHVIEFVEAGDGRIEVGHGVFVVALPRLDLAEEQLDSGGADGIVGGGNEAGRFFGIDPSAGEVPHLIAGPSSTDQEDEQVAVMLLGGRQLDRLVVETGSEWPRRGLVGAPRCFAEPADRTIVE